MALTSYLIIFLGGITSTFSPCILPLIPIYFSTISRGGRNLILGVIFLLAGFTGAFFLMQILIYKFANTISAIIGNEYFNKILGVIIIIFALHVLGLFKLSFLSAEKRGDVADKYDRGGYLFPLTLGLVLGLGWTPCTGPILFTVIGYATTAETIWESLLAIGAYSAGFALPFIILSVLVEKVKGITAFMNRYLKTIQKISGALLLVVGLMMFLNKLSILYSLFNY